MSCDYCDDYIREVEALQDKVRQLEDEIYDLRQENDKMKDALSTIYYEARKFV